jgi:hypothetical protein
MPGRELSRSLVATDLSVIFSDYSKPLNCANIRALNLSLVTSVTRDTFSSRNLSEVSRNHSHVARKFRLRLWIGLIAGAVPLAAWGTLSANPTLTPVAIFILAIIIGLLWRPGEPPVLVFACAVQWLQASLSIFCANYYHVPVEMLFGVPQGETATWLSLFGVLVVTIGIRIALLGVRSTETTGAMISKINVTTLFYLYIAGFFVFSVMQAVAFAIPGLAQLILAVANLKLALIFLLFYSVLEQRRGYSLLVIAFTLEMAVGFLG